MRYVDQFLSLRCAPDVLGAVGPINHKAAKEISEAMAVIRRVKGIVLNGGGPYVLIDLCSGNALVPVIASHLFQADRLFSAFAVDKRARGGGRRMDIERFAYVVQNIHEPLWGGFDEPVIITAVHACTKLAPRVIELYQQHGSHLVMVPCCSGPIKTKYSPLLREKLEPYELWAHHLAELAGGTVVRDPHMISPCNAVVTAKRAA